MSGFGINVWFLATQIVNFLILLLILYFFAYKPVMKMLDERSRKIRESMDEVQKVKDQAAQTEEEFKKKDRRRQQRRAGSDCPRHAQPVKKPGSGRSWKRNRKPRGCRKSARRNSTGT